MTAFWTKHDFDAHSDPKIIRLLANYDYEGYGWYWRIIEMMGAGTDHTLKLNDCDSIAYAMRTDSDSIEAFLRDCISYGLFVEVNGVIYSNRLCDELEEIDKKSESARVSANIRWAKYKAENANAMQTHNERNANRVEYNRVKKNTKEKKKDSSQARMSVDDFEAFWKQYPRKTNKATALKSFLKLDRSLLSVIDKALTLYKKHIAEQKTEPRYVLHAATWLNQERWQDEIPINGASQKAYSPEQIEQFKQLPINQLSPDQKRALGWNFAPGSGWSPPA